VLALEHRAVDRIDRLQDILDSTGLDLEAYMASFAADEFSGVGGPGIDIQDLEPYLDEDEDTADFSRYLVRASSHLDDLAVLQAAINNLPLLRPSEVYRMTDGYGMRRDPFNRRLRMHYGLDFAGPSGTPVLATAAGTVRRAGTMSGYGRVIEIDHGNGISTRYAHLRRINVSVGDEVSARQEIGQLGNTGRSTGPHVHYEVRFHGEPLDPLPFLEAGRHVFES
jgi:murein DD-endopeptidase MepM/ murein hydrolase activator NlpD